ncbi:MAG: 30S ribosomal protein S2 [Candidatus Portnoybacteria bacterium CG06_land_8_20_14_3_00_39_12]|uniref:Small ribosomal subunit protein uS2 n=3 Tax=Candidatus Portnoyibacteriota TaxID=1817913 RepID=A0A2M7UKA1_9BACT|nr:MAG: 30S ribosomal protein S2 [Candidatus Portnoybacteria bacterium CG06_land_8_20_14_3_00_39_12]PIZ71630.1 MAG: 30S ribosomal protein S2 [Candidatus Portnoybacteria bacterium CG_4_10_14_0_2_um_filter_39_11]
MSEPKKKTIKKIIKSIIKKPAKEAVKKAVVEIPSLEDMVKAGVHFGHRISKWNPKMEPYIFGQKETVHIIDLEKTQAMLKIALEFLVKTMSEGGKILFVGTKVANREVVKELAEQSNNFYVIERWLGGTLTNFGGISKRLKHFLDLEEKIRTGELAKYTKKEQHDFNLEKQKLERRFGGIKHMEKLPEVVFCFDARENHLALKEAKDKGVVTMALCDTNVDTSKVDYIIPSNDDASTAIRLMAEAIKKAIS